ncbi:unnamed protein product [Miscanthus lutarioriparius]|uniref:Uncharacterized protein n=1 Tax=Miscanthus lutarioriparius TaxID=422564 RepID=A0A811QBH2_9POAL|nr:unnamed protein product [Miscanthus lutarioriparius]
MPRSQITNTIVMDVPYAELVVQITFFTVINLFHCDKCGCCYNNVMKDSHTAVSKEQYIPIALSASSLTEAISCCYIYSTNGMGDRKMNDFFNDKRMVPPGKSLMALNGALINIEDLDLCLNFGLSYCAQDQTAADKNDSVWYKNEETSTESEIMKERTIA